MLLHTAGLLALLANTALAGHWEGVCGARGSNSGMCVCTMDGEHGSCNGCSDFCGQCGELDDVCYTAQVISDGQEHRFNCRICRTPDCAYEFQTKDDTCVNAVPEEESSESEESSSDDGEDEGSDDDGSEDGSDDDGSEDGSDDDGSEDGSDEDSEDMEALDALRAACASSIETCSTNLGYNCADPEMDCEEDADDAFIGCIIDDACVDQYGHCCVLWRLMRVEDECGSDEGSEDDEDEGSDDDDSSDEGSEDEEDEGSDDDDSSDEGSDDDGSDEGSDDDGSDDSGSGSDDDDEDEEEELDDIIFPLPEMEASELLLKQLEIAERTDVYQECMLESHDVKVWVDLYGSAFGNFRVEGCEGLSPTLIMAAGETYNFIQEDWTNWLHPLGFAYAPDGYHRDNEDLEGDCTAQGCDEDCGDNPCCETETCTAPLFQQDGEVIEDGEDAYEDAFTSSPGDWDESGPWSMSLTITDDTPEIWYYCQVHAGMSGRVKICDRTEDGCTVREAPEDTMQTQLYVVYNVPPVHTEFEKTCGATNVDMFKPETIADYCGEQEFLCDAGANGARNIFAECMRAIDCKMNYDMRVNFASDHPSGHVASFIHQMIPHHQNAVSMAKVLLKEVDRDGYELHWEIKNMLREIINGQNAQIHLMNLWLGAYEHPTPGDVRCTIGCPRFSMDKASLKGQNVASKKLKGEAPHDCECSEFCASQDGAEYWFLSVSKKGKATCKCMRNLTSVAIKKKGNMTAGGLTKAAHNALAQKSNE